MIRTYTCIICGWAKDSINILAFNKHASFEHREVFYDNDEQVSRNDKRLRDYVNISRVKHKTRTT